LAVVDGQEKPGGQEEHWSAAWGAKVPPRQAEGAMEASGHAYPAGQMRQEDCPSTFWYVPPAQAVQLVASAMEK
jgi:hypothetical protein